MNISSKLEQQVKEEIASIDTFAEKIPGVVLVLWCNSGLVEYISPRGQRLLGSTLAEIKAMGLEYYERFFNPEDTEYYVPKLIGMVERNDFNEYITFFQQVRSGPNQEYVWHLSSTKILMRDEDGKPMLSIVISIPVDPEHYMTPKVGKLLEENIFLRENYARFSKLSKREQNILQLMALGKSSPEIAEVLFISVATVDTHRRNIKTKLDANSSYELAKYAHAFNLI